MSSASVPKGWGTFTTVLPDLATGAARRCRSPLRRRRPLVPAALRTTRGARADIPRQTAAAMARGGCGGGTRAAGGCPARRSGHPPATRQPRRRGGTAGCCHLPGSGRTAAPLVGGGEWRGGFVMEGIVSRGSGARGVGGGCCERAGAGSGRVPPLVDSGSCAEAAAAGGATAGGRGHPAERRRWPPRQSLTLQPLGLIPWAGCRPSPPTAAVRCASATLHPRPPPRLSAARDGRENLPRNAHTWRGHGAPPTPPWATARAWVGLPRVAQWARPYRRSENAYAPPLPGRSRTSDAAIRLHDARAGSAPPLFFVLNRGGSPQTGPAAAARLPPADDAGRAPSRGAPRPAPIR